MSGPLYKQIALELHQKILSGELAPEEQLPNEAELKGIVQCGSRLRMLVRVPNEEEARFFGIPGDGSVSVVSLIRTGYEDKPGDGPVPFRVTFTILPADRNQFVVNRGKVPGELPAPARDQ